MLNLTHLDLEQAKENTNLNQQIKKAMTQNLLILFTK